MGLALINFSKNSYPYHRYACGLYFFPEIYLSALILKPSFYHLMRWAGIHLENVFSDHIGPTDPVFYHPKRLCIRKVMINENDLNSPE
jgi:hypothetical protein